MRLKSIAIRILLATVIAESLSSNAFAEGYCPSEASAEAETLSSPVCEGDSIGEEALACMENSPAETMEITREDASDIDGAPSDEPLAPEATKAYDFTTEGVGPQGAQTPAPASGSDDGPTCNTIECEHPDASLATSAIETPTLPTVAVIADAKSGKVIDVKSGSLANSAKVQLWESNSSEAQRFRLELQQDSGFYLIRNVNSHKVLDVKGARASIGTVVHQYAQNGTAAQLWAVEERGDGAYNIVSALASPGLQLVLGWSSYSNQLELQNLNTADQNWLLTDTRTIEDGVYRFSSLESSRVLDVTGGSIASGANAQTYASNGSNAQRFTVTYDRESGYYTVANTASGMALDVYGASKKTGANIQFYRPNNTNAQQWSIERIGNAFRIVSRCSRLAMSCGGKSPNPNNVIQTGIRNALSQQWVLEAVDPIADGTYEIRSFANNELCLDVAGGRAEYTTNVQVYRRNGTDAQRFVVTRYDNDSYTIRSVISGLYVSIFSSSSLPKTNIHVDGGADVDAGRLWKAVARPGGISFVSETGLCIDVAGGRLVSSTNVQGYTQNGTKAQQFVLSRASAKVPGITEFATRAQSPGNPSGITIRSLLQNDGSILHVPEETDVTRFELLYAPIKAGEYARIAPSTDGTYDLVKPGDCINLLEKARAIDSSSYELWVGMENAQLPQRLIIKLSGSSLESITPHVYSHRGTPSEFIEHSLQGYDRARTYGSKYIEQDVVCSADGTLFVSHDASAKRLTGVDRAYDQMSDEEIRQLITSQGTAILRLEDVFEQYGDSVVYLIELKDNNAVNPLLSLIESYGDSIGPVIVQSSDLETITALHAQNASLRTLLLADNANIFAEAVSNSHVDIISVNQQLVNESLVAAAHNNNKEFNVWTLNTIEAITEAIRLGVDSYFTDYTQKAIPLELALRK